MESETQARKVEGGDSKNERNQSQGHGGRANMAGRVQDKATLAVNSGEKNRKRLPKDKMETMGGDPGEECSDLHRKNGLCEKNLGGKRKRSI